MSFKSSRLGRKPLVAARIVRAMRALAARSEPITTAALRKQEPGMAPSSVFQAVQRLQEQAGLLVRFIPGTNVREYCLGSQAYRWGIPRSPEQIRESAREETILTLILDDHERGKR